MIIQNLKDNFLSACESMYDPKIKEAVAAGNIQDAMGMALRKAWALDVFNTAGTSIGDLEGITIEQPDVDFNTWMHELDGEQLTSILEPYGITWIHCLLSIGQALAAEKAVKGK